MYMLKYWYENGNGALKMINKSSKNKNNPLIYIINEGIKIEQHQLKKISGQRNKQGKQSAV